jgi:hypothetical protein
MALARTEKSVARPSWHTWYVMIRTAAVTEILLRFGQFHRRSLS